MEIEEEKIIVSQAMIRFGGSFMKGIGEALSHADHNNQRKIKLMWPMDWEKYLEFGVKDK